MDLLERIQKIPLGYSELIYNRKRYGVTRTDFNSGKSIKVYAEELGDTNFISFNYYIKTNEGLLKPCEMPKNKVVHFLNNYQIV